MLMLFQDISLLIADLRNIYELLIIRYLSQNWCLFVVIIYLSISYMYKQGYILYMYVSHLQKLETRMEIKKRLKINLF